MGPVSKPHAATVADWLAQPEDARLEFIDGALIEKAAPTLGHGAAQLGFGVVRESFGRKTGGPRGPGGWWIASEVDLLLDGRGYRPDVVGWRREHLPSPPETRPVTVRPDWVCEILSESNRGHDLVVKLRYYAQAGIPHYWTVDPAAATLTVHRLEHGNYSIVLAAQAGETVRAEPFDAIELSVSRLTGRDDD